MKNVQKNSYALTLVCPIKIGDSNFQSFASLTRQNIQTFDLHEKSPLANVPNTFMARFYLLDDVFYEGSPAKEDHLESHYLVFCANFYGDLETYLTGFWQNAAEDAKRIWQHCVAFDDVKDTASFISYIKKCQLDTTFYFNGSSGEPLAEQLKALYLKQEFTEFVIQNQGASAAELKAAFDAFVANTQPENLAAPTWVAGKNSL